MHSVGIGVVMLHLISLGTPTASPVASAVAATLLPSAASLPER
jgi:hypothetical protein